MIVNANSTVYLAIQIKNGIMINANVSVKIIAHAKNIIVEILAHVFARMVSIFKHIVGDLVNLCHEIIYVVDNVPSNVSINSGDKKVRYKMDCYILDTVLFVIILLFTITIIYCHYAKHKSKLKKRILYYYCKE